jgi:hypothetical protein
MPLLPRYVGYSISIPVATPAGTYPIFSFFVKCDILPEALVQLPQKYVPTFISSRTIACTNEGAEGGDSDKRNCSEAMADLWCNFYRTVRRGGRHDNSITWSILAVHYYGGALESIVPDAFPWSVMLFPRSCKRSACISTLEGNIKVFSKRQQPGRGLQ